MSEEGNVKQENDVSPRFQDNFFDEDSRKKGKWDPDLREHEDDDESPPTSPVASSEDENVLADFDYAKCRRALALLIIVNGFPFKFVEKQTFINLTEALQPEFKLPSHLEVAKDCVQIYQDEKVKMREFFKTSGVHVCISIDRWSCSFGFNYMCITARYVDNDWNLQRKIINFFNSEDLEGESMARQIDGCLREWGIAKVFAVTVENGSKYEACIEFLKQRLTSRACDVVEGKYLHMSCMTRMVNLIVSDVLEGVEESIERIREAIRCVNQLPEGMEIFWECCRDENIESDGLLYLDWPNRWNTTYLMLKLAVKFEKAFDRLPAKDPYFQNVPTSTDWEIVRKITDILSVFYESARRITAPFDVTSCLSYHEISTIGVLLKEWMDSSNEDLKEIGDKMKSKYDKYWGDLEKMNKLVCVAVVFDPRYKFEFLEYAFVHDYGEEKGLKMVVDLRLALDELFEAYKPKTDVKQIQGETESSENKSSSTYILSNKFKNHKLHQDIAKKSDLDVYLQEDTLDIENQDFDILKWWKQNEHRFPVLSVLARDVLSMPISSVALDSIFINGGKVLDSFRSCLPPKMMEALVCAQSWFASPKEIAIEDDLESILEEEAQMRKLDEGNEDMVMDVDEYGSDFEA